MASYDHAKVQHFIGQYTIYRVYTLPWICPGFQPRFRRLSPLASLIAVARLVRGGGGDAFSFCLTGEMSVPGMRDRIFFTLKAICGHQI